MVLNDKVINIIKPVKGNYSNRPTGPGLMNYSKINRKYDVVPFVV